MFTFSILHWIIFACAVRWQYLYAMPLYPPEQCSRTSFPVRRANLPPSTVQSDFIPFSSCQSTPLNSAIRLNLLFAVPVNHPQQCSPTSFLFRRANLLPSIVQSDFIYFSLFQSTPLPPNSAVRLHYLCAVPVYHPQQCRPTSLSVRHSSLPSSTVQSGFNTCAPCYFTPLNSATWLRYACTMLVYQFYSAARRHNQ